MKHLARWTAVFLAAAIALPTIPVMPAMAEEDSQTAQVLEQEMQETSSVAENLQENGISAEATEAAQEPAAAETILPEAGSVQTSVEEQVSEETEAAQVSEGAKEEAAAPEEKAEKTAPAGTSDYNNVEPSYTVQADESGIRVAEAATAFAYTGSVVMFMKADGSEFGMWRLQEGSTYVLNGDNVEIHVVPSNTTVYGWMHWGSITDDPLTKDLALNADGTIDIVVSKDYCGLAHPIAPIKTDERGGGTTSSQYYLAIPAADLLPAKEDTDPDADADYSKVDAALEKVPDDLTIYTEETAKAVTDAVDAVERGKKATEQAAVDAMAEAIEAAVEALVLKPVEGRTELTVTNNTLMFKVVDAYVETKDGKSELVVAMSGNTYDNLFVGTYEEAVANGDNRDNWIQYFTDDNNRKAFRIPFEEGTTYFPIISISNTYLSGYEKNNNPLARAFYARQFELDLEKKTLVTGDYEYTQALTIQNNVTMFKPVTAAIKTVGGPNNNNYQSSLVLTLGSDAFDKAFVGTKEQAAEAATSFEIGADRTLTFPVKWVETFGKPETMQTLIGTPFTVSFHSVNKDAWYERIFTINEKNGTLVIDPVSEDTPVNPVTPVVPTPVVDPSSGGGSSEEGGGTSSLGGGTGAVDNSTALADGVYTPDKFSFSGGTGKIVITCTQIEVRGGQAYATIVFQNIKSGSTEMSYVKASGGTYYCTQVGGTSVATIPIELNKNNTILAMTTKMSSAHEIQYVIFAYIAGADAQKGSSLSSNTTIDTEAPVIAGLEYVNEESIDEAEYFKIFNYENGIRLLEIDMTVEEKDEKIEEETEEKETEEIETEEIPEEEKAGTTFIDEETGEEVTIIATKEEAQAELYKGNVVKYLLVPENVEIPAGLDKETIVIPLPVKSVYSGSEAISKTMKELGADKLITCQEKEDKENNLAGVGTYKDMDYRTLVKNKCDVVMLSNDILKDKTEREYFVSLGSDLASLEIAQIVDRSEMEETEKAKAEWLKVYGILFGCEEAAQQAYDAVK